MFNVGDTIVYTTCGLCKIDSITKKVFNGEEREYVVDLDRIHFFDKDTTERIK